MHKYLRRATSSFGWDVSSEAMTWRLIGKVSPALIHIALVNTARDRSTCIGDAGSLWAADVVGQGHRGAVDHHGGLVRLGLDAADNVTGTATGGAVGS
jgi:hypothetical protein